MWSDSLPGIVPAAPLPFSFLYGGAHSSEVLPDWRRSEITIALSGGRQKRVTFTDPGTWLRVIHETTRFDDFPAVEWLLQFEHTGDEDTPIIQDVLALDVELESPIDEATPFVLHRTRGAPSNATDFEMSVTPIRGNDSLVLSAGGGRSSNRDFPFFRVDTARGAAIVAVGWSGQWQAAVQCNDGRRLRVTAGLERTHFRLHPQETVRGPRILVLFHEGDPEESHAVFRRLIHEHYAARFRGEKPAPFLYCNTCFTRKGRWLNECNEANQISLIRALAPLGVQAAITDAGWFEGGWPKGAGNWTPRKDAYPNGVGPVAAAAKEYGMIYGLWFEPERVVAGTSIHKQHPEWLLWARDNPERALLNFGLEEVQEYFFGIVDEFMNLPGFGCYRQDFNMDPLPCWRDNDAPDREGITEMKYVEGLYAYWDRLADAHPDSFRVECASGGSRIDLETVMRFHVHQKSDYWFDNGVDQASLFGLSQYLPNGLVMAPIDRLDEYTFHSVLPSSLCLGWIADGPGFDLDSAKDFTRRYREVRHLLNGEWYPLTPYSRGPDRWLASQYHRPDLEEGMVLAFRREEARGENDDSLTVRLRSLDAGSIYEMESLGGGELEDASGAELMGAFRITIPKAPGSACIRYRKSSSSQSD